MPIPNLVSVIIPTHNGQAHLEEAIQSVLDQTYHNYELIVIDDGSPTDEVRKICDRYAGRLQYHRQENQGPSAARNEGIRRSRGQYVAFLDDDDLWLPSKLDRQVRLYGELTARGVNVGLVYTGYQAILGNGDDLCKVLYKASGDVFQSMLFVNLPGPPSAVLIDRAVFDEVGHFDEQLKGPEDWDMWQRIARTKSVHSVDEYLTLYRWRPESLCKNAAIMTRSLQTLYAKIVQTESGRGLLSKREARGLAHHYQSQSAILWKNAAYRCLFEHMDGKAFRTQVRMGWKVSPAVFGFKVLTYYLLSYVSAAMCLRIKKLKHRPASELFPNEIHDVKDLGYGHKA